MCLLLLAAKITNKPKITQLESGGAETWAGPSDSGSEPLHNAFVGLCCISEHVIEASCSPVPGHWELYHAQSRAGNGERNTGSVLHLGAVLLKHCPQPWVCLEEGSDSGKLAQFPLGTLIIPLGKGIHAMASVLGLGGIPHMKTFSFDNCPSICIKSGPSRAIWCIPLPPCRYISKSHQADQQSVKVTLAFPPKTVASLGLL